MTRMMILKSTKFMTIMMITPLPPWLLNPLFEPLLMIINALNLFFVVRLDPIILFFLMLFACSYSFITRSFWKHTHRHKKRSLVLNVPTYYGIKNSIGLTVKISARYQVRQEEHLIHMIVVFLVYIHSGVSMSTRLIEALSGAKIERNTP